VIPKPVLIKLPVTELSGGLRKKQSLSEAVIAKQQQAQEEQRKSSKSPHYFNLAPLGSGLKAGNDLLIETMISNDHGL
jgi:hypothetical protein